MRKRVKLTPTQLQQARCLDSLSFFEKEKGLKETLNQLVSSLSFESRDQPETRFQTHTPKTQTPPLLVCVSIAYPSNVFPFLEEIRTTFKKYGNVAAFKATSGLFYFFNNS